MRLNRKQIQTILSRVKNARIFLFGSRLDDDKTGGDINLFLETDQALGVLEKSKIQAALEDELYLPVDIVACARGSELSAFEKLAKLNAVELK